MKSDFFVIQEMYTPQECAEIRNVIERHINPAFVGQPAAGVTKTVEASGCLFGPCRQHLERYRNAVINVNKMVFGLDLFEISDFDILNYNRYTEQKQGEYGWHKDSVVNECRDIKLTAILNLSEQNYTGGEFYFHLNQPRHVPEISTPGTLLIFPSWTQHKVEPITSGERISMSMWFAGPNLK